ncbi:MAG: hypothetical protein ACP5GI_05800 [Sulfolobales archaeon]
MDDDSKTRSQYFAKHILRDQCNRVLINLVIGIFWAYVFWRLADDTEASLFKAVAVIIVVSSILNANGILGIVELIILWMAINEAIRKTEEKIYRLETT